MHTKELSFFNQPIVNIPFVTSPLLKVHGRIVTILEPFNLDENCVWQAVKRIAALFSSLFVYPSLGILVLVSSISAKFRKTSTSDSAKFRKTSTADDDIIVIASKRSFFDPSLTIAEREALLIQETVRLEEENRILRDKINRIFSFVKNNSELRTTFAACYDETKEILLPLPKRDDSPPTPNPLIEAWRQAAQEQSYLLTLKTRIRDFLDKNPDFCKAVETQNESRGLALLF
ncbi:MAG: hypothetical protein ACHQUC_03705 [Chlamydiales bacterium]